MALKATLEELGMSIAPDNNNNNRRRSKVQNRAIPRHNKTEGQEPAEKGKTMSQNAHAQNAQHATTGSEMADKARQMLVEQIGQEASQRFERAVKEINDGNTAIMMTELKKLIDESRGDTGLESVLKEHTRQLALGLAEAGQANAKVVLEEVEKLHAAVAGEDGNLLERTRSAAAQAASTARAAAADTSAALCTMEANVNELLEFLKEKETRDQKRARLTRTILFWTAVAAAAGLVGYGVVTIVRYMLSSPKLVAQVPPGIGTGTLDATMASPVGNSLPTL